MQVYFIIKVYKYIYIDILHLSNLFYTSMNVFNNVKEKVQ